MHDTSPLFAAALRQCRLIRKELMEILRDRRTIVTLVVMPLLIYPLLGVGFTQFLRAMAPMKEPKFVVGAEHGRPLQVFAQIERQFAKKLRALASDANRAPAWEFVAVQSVDAALRSGEIDIGIALDKS